MRLIIFKQQCVSIQNAEIYGLVIFVADKKMETTSCDFDTNQIGYP